jgi:hypothetical protein
MRPAEKILASYKNIWSRRKKFLLHIKIYEAGGKNSCFIFFYMKPAEKILASYFFIWSRRKKFLLHIFLYGAGGKNSCLYTARGLVLCIACGKPDIVLAAQSAARTIKINEQNHAA